MLISSPFKAIGSKPSGQSHRVRAIGSKPSGQSHRVSAIASELSWRGVLEVLDPAEAHVVVGAGLVDEKFRRMGGVAIERLVSAQHGAGHHIVGLPLPFLVVDDVVAFALD